MKVYVNAAQVKTRKVLSFEMRFCERKDENQIEHRLYMVHCRWYQSTTKA